MTLPTPLVTVDWLMNHPLDPVILDCRFALADPDKGRHAYDQGHIPGAYYLDLNQDLSSPVQAHGGRHPLPVPETLGAKFGQCGIDSQRSTPVVIYDDFRGAFAARCWWLLRYYGHGPVAVLQGGIAAWTGTGRSLVTDSPPAQAATFTPQIQTDWILDYGQVRERQQQGKGVLVDARSPERFRGEQEPIDPIAGSIPGAINRFWQQVVDGQGQFLPPAALQAYWSDLTPEQAPVMYCGSGVTACVNLLSRAAAGYPMAPLYGGGWSDWCSYLAKVQ
ncbi:MAG: sulfurtransferase [Cyanobacteria bacterium]|nr:sulfurtransferase [Cyanobacteriota bacterium]MDA0866246.1 sulfurtransferase [Cyanobacteriota bacterium]